MVEMSFQTTFINLNKEKKKAMFKQYRLSGPTTQQWLLNSIQDMTVPWKFKEHKACKRGNNVNVVKISPYIHTHTHYHGFIERAC